MFLSEIVIITKCISDMNHLLAENKAVKTKKKDFILLLIKM